MARFTVSMDRELLRRFDALLQAENCPSRSKGIADLIRAALVERQWHAGGNVAGAIVLIYNPHRRGLLSSLMAIQHEHHHLILSNQHVHLDHDHCLEIIALRGPADDLRRLYRAIRAIKQLQFVTLAAATTGSAWP